MRQIRVSPAKRRRPGIEVDVIIRHNDAQATEVALSREELMDLGIRIMTFFRDYGDGMYGATHPERMSCATEYEHPSHRWSHGDSHVCPGVK